TFMTPEKGPSSQSLFKLADPFSLIILSFFRMNQTSPLICFQENQILHILKNSLSVTVDRKLSVHLHLSCRCLSLVMCKAAVQDFLMPSFFIRFQHIIITA